MSINLRKQVKIAFFDIDGTLIHTETKNMSEHTKEALRALKAKGIKIVVATGRVPNNIPPLGDIDFDAFVTFNGSYCHASGKEIFTCPHILEDVNIMIENAKKMDHPLFIATRLGGAWTLKDLPKGEPIYQLMMGDLPENYKDVLKGTTNAKMMSWISHAVDIIPMGSGKDIGIQKVLDYYHLSPEEAIAFGDGGNDIVMLKAVGHGVAMGNSPKEVKEAADAICSSIEEDGIYYYLKDNGII